MTREELNEVLADIQPILKANSECKIDVETTDCAIHLKTEYNGFPGYFLDTIGAYLKAQAIAWVVEVTDGKIELEIF